MAEVIEIIELGDGGAEVTLELTKEEVQMLLNDAITRAVQNYVLFDSLNKLSEKQNGD